MLQTLYTECMLHTTAYRFPGILRWFEVIETDVVSFNYIEFLVQQQETSSTLFSTANFFTCIRGERMIHSRHLYLCMHVYSRWYAYSTYPTQLYFQTISLSPDVPFNNCVPWLLLIAAKRILEGKTCHIVRLLYCVNKMHDVISARKFTFWYFS